MTGFASDARKSIPAREYPIAPRKSVAKGTLACGMATPPPRAVVEIASGDDGAAVGRRFADLGVEVVLVIQTMAVPAAWTMAAIDALPGVPVVIWALHETGLVEGGVGGSDRTLPPPPRSQRAGSRVGAAARERW